MNASKRRRLWLVGLWLRHMGDQVEAAEEQVARQEYRSRDTDRRIAHLSRVIEGDPA